jgi:hypothetical protein
MAPSKVKGYSWSERNRYTPIIDTVSTCTRKAKGLKAEIASAQRLVVKSATLVRRLAGELDNHRPTLSERTISAI